MSATVPRIAVIGGGYAGMAAAVTLAEAGVPPTVFEAAPLLGGRARRVEHRGAALDNGLHILSGAYADILDLIRRVASPDPLGPLLWRRSFDWILQPDFRLRRGPLPGAAGLALGMLAARGARLGERLAALRFGAAVDRIAPDPDVTVAMLLARHRQGATLRHRFWEPLCLAALNTPAEQASGRTFVRVLQATLRGPAGSSDILLPRVDLSALFPEPAARHVLQRGGAIRTAASVSEIRRQQGQFLLRTAKQAELFSHVICAVAPGALPLLTRRLPELAPLPERLAHWRFQPIYSVYLQYPEHATLPQPMTGFAEGWGQWVFDRGAIAGQRGLIGVVVSGPGDHQGTPLESLADRAEAQLRAHFPGLGKPLWRKVIAEKRATFSCVPGLQRPPQTTPVENFFLAGDYTHPEYPATLEGAAQSGIRSARLALASL